VLFRKLDIIAYYDRNVEKEIEKFIMHGTFTAKLATVKKDGGLCAFEYLSYHSSI
jgi:hypothetical protein